MRKKLCPIVKVLSFIMLFILLLPAASAGAALTVHSYYWHTFMGGADAELPDELYTVGTDENGNIYLAGTSLDTWNGPAGQLPLSPFPGNKALVIIKLSKTGAYLWHTFYGSGSFTIPKDLAVDMDGNVAVVGETNGDFQYMTGIDPLNPFTNSTDLFILKLASDGSYEWRAFYGSDQTDYGTGVALDGLGNIIVAGIGYQTWQGPADEDPLNGFAGSVDMFVLKLSPAGEYQWHTFYGSAVETDQAFDITTDSQGHVYLAGVSYAGWNGPLAQSPLNPYTGSSDMTVVSLQPDGEYKWHAFYGSTQLEEGYSIAVDEAGGIYIAGRAEGEWVFPDGSVPPLHGYTGSADILVLKLKPSGMEANPISYDWHAYFGSDLNEQNPRIAVQNGVFLTFTSEAAWLGPDGAGPTNAYTGGKDMTILALTDGGDYQWHAFYGSPASDEARSLAVDRNRNLVLAGFGTSEWDGPGGAASLLPHPGGKTAHTVVKLTLPQSMPFLSSGTYDGWILESSETSGKGGTLNKGAATFNVGDDAANKQYRSILSFNTAGLPDNAVITKVTLRVKRAGVVGGGNPITTFNGFMVDLKKGSFGTSALALSDFNAKAGKTLGAFKPTLSGGWYAINLTGGKAQVNLTGTTQIRLRFKTDDNNNFIANFLKLYSGNAGSSSRPQLIIEYYTP